MPKRDSPAGEDGEGRRYTFPCRCGDEFEVFAAELDDGVELVPCYGCSLQIRVVAIDDRR